MSNIIKYVEVHTRPMQEDDFNTVDGLVLAELSYIKWNMIWNQRDQIKDETLKKMGLTRDDLDSLHIGGKGLTLAQAIALLKDTDGYRQADPDKQELLDKLYNSERFRDIKISNFAENLSQDQNKLDEQDYKERRANLNQMAAVIFTYETKSKDTPVYYISHRGTDGTIEGWYEDFLMAFTPETNAQRDSLAYLNMVVPLLNPEYEIVMGGHSKGGNHANYAYLFTDESIRKRITKLYSFDGPGFHGEISYNGQKVDQNIYNEMLRLLDGTAICPFDSVVGQLLHENGFTFIKTRLSDSSSYGEDADKGVSLLLDHDPFTWQVNMDGTFVENENGQELESKYVNLFVKKWIESCTEDELKAFIYNIFDWGDDLIPEKNLYVQTLDEFGEAIKNNPLSSLTIFGQRFFSLDDKERVDFELSLTKAVLSFKAVYDHLSQEEQKAAREAISNFIDNMIRGIVINKADEITDPLKKDMEKNLSLMMQKFSDALEQNGIHGVIDFIVLAAQDNSVIYEVLHSLVMDKTFWEIAGKLLKDNVLLNIVSLLIPVAVILVKGVTATIVGCISAILTTLILIDIITFKMEEFFEKLQNIISKGIEYAEEAIGQFVEKMQDAIQKAANEMADVLFESYSSLIRIYEKWDDKAIRSLNHIRDYTKRTLAAVMRYTRPLLYAAIRTVTGIRQSVVTVDMIRLENAVDNMLRIANRVQNMDIRLSNLYNQLSANNIEQEEGIFTSLVKMYHLHKANVEVDQGATIRRKANDISEIFNDYKKAERTIINMLN